MREALKKLIRDGMQSHGQEIHAEHVLMRSCPKCQSANTDLVMQGASVKADLSIVDFLVCRCLDCGHVYTKTFKTAPWIPPSPTAKNLSKVGGRPKPKKQE